VRWPSCSTWPSGTTVPFDRSAGRIVLVDALDRLLTPFRESAADYAAGTLRGRASSSGWAATSRRCAADAVELDDGHSHPDTHRGVGRRR